MKPTTNWFEAWFNSPYYHLLYDERDEQEAARFIDQLMQKGILQYPTGKCVLDLACGRGRHAVYLADKGYEAVGVDLSSDNIAFASRFENELLSFFVHDMRKLFRVNYFDYVINLFTSFGYFDTEKENLRALENIAKSLRPQGVLVMDFFNVHHLCQNMVIEEEVNKNGVLFHIERKIEPTYPHKRFCVKEIRIRDRGCEWHFIEKVQALELIDFEKYFSLAGFKILNLFGNYQLEPFHADTSERLILVAQKK